MIITWDQVQAGDVITGPDGLEWFVHDRSDYGQFALQRAGIGPIVGSPSLTAEVELNYRGQLGNAVDLLGGEVISHEG